MKIFVRLGIFFAICFGLFAFRHYLIGTALELAIPRITGESVVYRSRTWEEGRLVYHGFGLGDQFQAEKASFECNFHLFPLSVEPRIRFVKPLIQLEENNTSTVNLAFLVPSKYLAMKLDILGGSLMTREGALYPFEFNSGSSREEIGTLRLQDLLTCSLYLHENMPTFNLEMQNSSLEKLFPLASQFYPIKKLEGTLTTHLQGKIGPQFLTSLQGECAVKNFHFESEEMILALDDLVGQVDFEGDVKTLVLNADFKGADFFWKELEILRARGSLVFQPSEKPFFEIHGGVHLKNLEGQADIIGHGEVHPGGPLWLQGKMDYVTQSAPMSIDFSWVDQGDSQVLQTDLHNLSYEVLKMILPVKSGVLDAKLTTFFNRFVYQKTEISDLKAMELSMDRFSVHQIEAQGLVNLLTKNVESLSFQVQELQGQFEGWNISGLYASVKMTDNVFEPSSAFGKIENIPLLMEFQGPLSKIHGVAKLAAGASEWLQLPKNPAEPPIQAQLTLDIENSKLNILGKLTCLDDHIDLAASAHLVEKKWKGNFQGTLFSSYDPFLKVSCPDAKVRGEIAVQGVFSNEKLEAVLQGHEMTLEAFGMKASLPGQSREVRIWYDFAQKNLSAVGELSSVILSQGEVNTSIEGGEFSFSQNLLTCRNLCGQFFLHNYRAEFIGDLTYDTISHRLHMDHVEGALTAPLGEKIDFRSEHIQNWGSDWNFDAAFFQNSQTLLTLKGSGHEFTQGCDFVLNEATAAGSYLKTPLSVRWHLGKIERAQGVIFLQIDNLAHQLLLLDHFGVFKLSKDTEELIKQLQGNLVLHVDHHISHTDFVLDGSDVTYDTSRVEKIQARLHQEGGVWTLSHCQIDEVNCQGEAVQQGDKWVISALDLHWKDLSLYTSGRFEERKLYFDLTGGWTKRFTLQGQGIFAARQLSNFSLKLFDEQEPLAELALDKLSCLLDKWESPAVKLKIFSKHFAKPVIADLIVTLSRRGCTFQGPFSAGSATVGKSELKLGQLFALYEAPHLHFKCSATLDDEPLQFIGKFSEQLLGGIHMQQGSDLLKLTLSDPTTVQKVEGELLGVGMTLMRKNSGFEGIVTLKDGVKVSKLIDNEALKEFSGLQLKGLFGFEGSFKGVIEGQEACLMNYLVGAVSAKIDYTPTQFKLKDVLLQDASGAVTIKECLGMRTSSQDDWTIAIPFLKGQEIKPSLLRKKSQPASEPKPFQIRQLALSDIKGKPTDLTSMKAQGTLFFTQRVKKEPSLFDIPYALMKDLGLDLDLFTPVMGEIRVALKDGKLFFTDMQNTFSEGKRSEFSLANELSFIDLSGRLFLNFRMRQNAALKLAEPFMISVRGTWEKPKYSLN